MSTGCLTDVPGIKVGHSTDRVAATGCTAIIAEEGATGGVDVRGCYPGTRDTSMLEASRTSVVVHAIVLAGGSNFGLDTASGVVEFLELGGFGHRTGKFLIPRVSAAVIFDLAVGRPLRPGRDEGFAACESAMSASVPQGSVGAGTGATVGKLLGNRRAMKGGFGTASLALGDGLFVGAAVVTNAIGGIYDPETGICVAGPLSEDRRSVVDAVNICLRPGHRMPSSPTGINTTVGIVATNARLNSIQANQLASLAHNGLALAIRPVHTEFDGDTMFCLATRTCAADFDLTQLGVAVTVVTARAVLASINCAVGLYGFPSRSDLDPG